MGYIKAYQKIKNKIRVMTFYDNVHGNRTDKEIFTAYETAKKSGMGSTLDHPESEFLEKFNLSARPSEIGFMPPAVRYVDMASRVIVFEAVPQVKKISLSNVAKHRVDKFNTSIYNIAVPWQIYIATFDIQMNLATLKIYYSKGPIESFDHQLYSVPLFNVYDDGRVCLPDHPGEYYKQNKNYCDLIVDAIEDFWMSSFNTDLWDNMNGDVLRFIRDRNVKILGDLSKTKKFDVYSLYDIYAGLSLDEIMELEFVPYLKLAQVVPMTNVNSISNTAIIQQLTLRNC